MTKIEQVVKENVKITIEEYINRVLEEAFSTNSYFTIKSIMQTIYEKMKKEGKI